MINLRRCFFHSIVPIKKENEVFNIEENQLDRLRIMLQNRYLVPGNMLKDIIPEEYGSLYRTSISDSVYLAQHRLTELPSYGGSFFGGEFSAYDEHIVANPSWVFDEHIVEGKKINDRAHFLSEEVCVQEPLDLYSAIAIMLPYETPATFVSKLLMYKDCSFVFEAGFYNEKLEKILRDRKKLIDEIYLKINRYKELLDRFGYEIPCINYLGMELDREKEFLFIEKNEEEARRLVRK